MICGLDIYPHKLILTDAVFIQIGLIAIKIKSVQGAKKQLRATGIQIYKLFSQFYNKTSDIEAAYLFILLNKH